MKINLKLELGQINMLLQCVAEKRSRLEAALLEPHTQAMEDFLIQEISSHNQLFSGLSDELTCHNEGATECKSK
jgi:hypothetical protein